MVNKIDLNDSSKVLIKNVFIKLQDGKRFKSILFIHKGELKSILTEYNVITPNEGTYIEFNRLMKLKIEV